MGDSSDTNSEMESNTLEQGSLNGISGIAVPSINNRNSEIMFPDSPVYEPEEDLTDPNLDVDKIQVQEVESNVTQDSTNIKRKLFEDVSDSKTKLQKLDRFIISSQTLDDEVSKITSTGLLSNENFNDLTLEDSNYAATSTKKNKRSNSENPSSAKKKLTRLPINRPVSVDVSKLRRTPRKNKNGSPQKTLSNLAENENLSDSMECDQSSQDLHLVLSPALEDKSDDTKKLTTKLLHSSDPVVVDDRQEYIDPGKISQTRSEGFTYSEQSSSSQKKQDYKGNTADLEATDNIGSMLDSPDIIPTVASKLISKLSNGNSSTPTELATSGKELSTNNNTPDMAKIDNIGIRGTIESFRVSNNTTPSTISPLQNGHSLPINTPSLPVFDVHVSHNEDGEFLSLYVIRTDNDIGMDMCKEYQRLSKRFTNDPYMGDVSVSTSPSSVTSVGMIAIPNRASFVSIASSTSSSSNRTSDGNFVVPQPPRKSISLPSISIKGYDALMKKLQDIFSHIRENSVDDSLTDYKVSVGIQTSVSSDTTVTNGNASPKVVNRCDKVTPKSSYKKTKGRCRRHMAAKSLQEKTIVEEPLYVESINSPEMVPVNGDKKRFLSTKALDDEKPVAATCTTPEMRTKPKRLVTSPRPATPAAKPNVQFENSDYEPNTVVLAKWVNKRYYSGKVVGITDPNKYLIKFDDGHTKTILDEFIIFGDKKKLPLQGQSIYALIDEEQNYEPALVLDVEENRDGKVMYKCTTDGDTMVMVTASELYLTEDQARSLKDTLPRPVINVNSPRRHNTDLDLDNIIQGPRSARSRDKRNTHLRRRVASPRSPKASTSGLKTKSTPCRRRLASESSELSESSNLVAPCIIEEVAGVEPEIQRTPRKIDGIKAGPLQLKGAAKQNIVKKNSKLTKFENDENTVSVLGPIPSSDSKLFAGLHFLLTCTEHPRPNSNKSKADKDQETKHYSSEEDGETTSSMAGTDTEDLEFSDRPFNKERLKEQLEAGGGIIYSHFDDVPKNKYSVCKLIAPRPCLTAKYIQCLAADIPAVSHAWVIISCIKNELMDTDAFILPAGWSILKQCFINWVPAIGKRNTGFFKDTTILICGEQDTFVEFWQRVCTLVGANTRVVNEEDLNMHGALALVTEWDCPHEVQNKANLDNIPLVSTTWVIQCLIEAKVIAPTCHDRFSFMYTETE